MKTYTHPQETWNVAKCAKMAKARRIDGCGTPGPAGLIASSASSYPEYGQTIRFNGGRVIDGEWYEAEARPLPIIASGYQFEKRSSWGTFIVKSK